MAATLNADICEALLARIDRLRPDASPRWGRMAAEQMVCHLGDQLQIALGDLDARPIPGPGHYTPVKQFMIYVMPWPKGKVRAPPESRTTKPSTWAQDVGMLQTLLKRFAEHDRGSTWPPHPYFGAMSGALWGGFTRRHFDHHLTQFGA